MRPLDPEAQLGYLVVRAAEELSRAWFAGLRRHGINPREFSVLAILVRDPALSQGELARRVMVTPQSMSDLIAGLVGAGLLERGRVEAGRAARLAVTARGKALLRRAYPVVDALERANFAALSSTEREALAVLLRKLLARSGRARAHPPPPPPSGGPGGGSPRG